MIPNSHSEGEGRRSFIKKSMVTAAAVGQPLFLAGLIRAAAGAAAAAITSEPPPPGKSTTDPYTTFYTTMVYYQYGLAEDTTVDFGDGYTYF